MNSLKPFYINFLIVYTIVFLHFNSLKFDCDQINFGVLNINLIVIKLLQTMYTTRYSVSLNNTINISESRNDHDQPHGIDFRLAMNTLEKDTKHVLPLRDTADIHQIFQFIL